MDCLVLSAYCGLSWFVVVSALSSFGARNRRVPCFILICLGSSLFGPVSRGSLLFRVVVVVSLCFSRFVRVSPGLG